MLPDPLLQPRQTNGADGCDEAPPKSVLYCVSAEASASTEVLELLSGSDTVRAVAVPLAFSYGVLIGKIWSEFTCRGRF